MHALLRRSSGRWFGVTTRGHQSPQLGEPIASDADASNASHTAFSLDLDFPSWQSVATILIILTMVRLWAAASAGLAPDEAYYWLWSRNPAFGYFDHPPMVAWWIWLSTRLLGDTEIAIRLPAILSALVTSLAVFWTARQLFSLSSIGLRAVLWFNAMILVGVGAMFQTPDAPSTMFWALALCALSVIWRTERSWCWLLVGLFAGLGCVSKYTNLFLGPGILVWLLVEPRARRWLYSPWFWAGGLVALAVFAPVILWNAQNDWISFSKQFGRMGAHEITLRYQLEFFLSQVGLLNPIIAYFGILAGAVALRKRTGDTPNPYLLLLTTMAPLAAYMVLHAFHDRVQANWLAPIYPQFAILAAAYAENQRASLRRVRLARAVVPLGVTISIVSLLCLAAPVHLPFPLRDLAGRLEGWDGLSGGLERLRAKSSANWIGTASYDLTAELAFYDQAHPPVREIVERERYSSDPLDGVLVTQPALLVLSEEQKKSGHFDRCFAAVDLVATISRQGAGGVLDRYVVEKVSGAPDDMMRGGCHAKPRHH